MTLRVKLTHLCIEAKTEGGDSLTVVLHRAQLARLQACMQRTRRLCRAHDIDGVLLSVASGNGPDFIACEATPESESWGELEVTMGGIAELASLTADAVSIECAEWIVEPDAVEFRFLQRHGDSWYRCHLMWSGPLAEAVDAILKEV